MTICQISDVGQGHSPLLLDSWPWPLIDLVFISVVRLLNVKREGKVIHYDHLLYLGFVCLFF